MGQVSPQHARVTPWRWHANGKRRKKEKNQQWGDRVPLSSRLPDQVQRGAPGVDGALYLSRPVPWAAAAQLSTGERVGAGSRPRAGGARAYLAVLTGQVQATLG